MNTSTITAMDKPEQPREFRNKRKSGLLEPSFLPVQEQDTMIPDSVITYWIKRKIEEKFGNIISQEIANIGQLTHETWKIDAYNVIKNIESMPDMAKFLASIHYANTNARNTQPVEKNNKSQSHSLNILLFISDMNSRGKVSTKINALNTLLPQLLFVITCNEWPIIQEHLYKCLHEENDEIFYLSLKAHARLINSPHPLHIKEGFRSLIEGLNLFYAVDSKPVIKYGSLGNSNNRELIRLMHLILYTINKIPRIYLRSNDKVIEEILSRFFDLIAIHYEDKTILSPYIILSGLDSRANWFQHILYGVHAQNYIFSILSKKTLLRNIVDQLSHPEEIRDSARCTSFIHSTRMLSSIVKYSQGRHIFPLETQNEDEPITLEQIYLDTVNYLNNNTTVLELEDMLMDGLPFLIKAGVLRSDSPLMRAIFQSLPTKVSPHMARTLETIVSTREGVRCLLGAHDIKTLFDVTAMSLRDQVECTPEAKATLLRTSGKLLQGHRGFSRYKDTQLITKAALCFQQQLITKSQEDLTREELFKFLSYVGSTPLGILAISRFSHLWSQLQEMWVEDQSDVSKRCLSLANILEKDENIEQITAFITSIAHVTIPKDKTNHVNSELYKFLKNSKGYLHDCHWHLHLRRAFKASSPQQTKTYIVLELLDHLTRDIVPSTSRIHSDTTSALPDKVTAQAAKWFIGYGDSNHLLPRSQPKHLENLLELFSSYRRSDSDGFNYFLGIAFLMCGGHIDKSYSFLNKVSSLPSASFFWPHKSSVHLQNFGFKFGHLIELLVEEELPVIAKVLKTVDLIPWQICRHWMTQCFLNVLSWDQICQWLIYCFISQPDHCVYFCIALLRHLQADLLQAVESGSLDQCWHLRQISGFQVTDQLHYMDKLAKRYGNIKL